MDAPTPQASPRRWIQAKLVNDHSDALVLYSAEPRDSRAGEQLPCVEAVCVGLLTGCGLVSFGRVGLGVAMVGRFTNASPPDHHPTTSQHATRQEAPRPMALQPSLALAVQRSCVADAAARARHAKP